MSKIHRFPGIADNYTNYVHKDAIFQAYHWINNHFLGSTFNGGILTFMTYSPDNMDSCRVATQMIRHPGAETARLAFENHEKLMRLFERRHRLKTNEISAMQSADPGLGTKGGCVVSIDPADKKTEVYIAFAGPHQMASEVLCMGLAKRFDLITPPYTLEKHFSENDLDQLMSEVVWG